MVAVFIAVYLWEMEEMAEYAILYPHENGLGFSVEKQVRDLKRDSKCSTGQGGNLNITCYPWIRLAVKFVYPFRGLMAFSSSCSAL